MLTLPMRIPVSTSDWIVSCDAEAGPSVQTIFVMPKPLDFAIVQERPSSVAWTADGNSAFVLTMNCFQGAAVGPSVAWPRRSVRRDAKSTRRAGHKFMMQPPCVREEV